MKLDNMLERKLINAILYFSKNVRYPYKLKMFKLLYILDFKHFKAVGRPVTNLEYFAWDFGPVPKKLFEDIDKNTLSEEFTKNIKIIKRDFGGFEFKGLKNYDLAVFSPREKKILEEIAYIFRDADAEQMSEISHLKNAPWDKTRKEKGRYEKIDYYLALDKEAKIDLKTAKERMKEREEMLTLFQ